ncbi:MAG: glycogen synthase GlgA [Gammaproteobacteria bacterium]|nr:glycogen synthase GlgA [Gammaproteobacteria bacterium]
MKHKILFISSEAFPLIKTGGLADVAGSLPIALQDNDQDVCLLLPAYQSILEQIIETKVVAETSHYGLKINILETTLPGSSIKTWLIDCPQMFDRPGNPYMAEDGNPWRDNAERFALFSQAAVDIALNRCGLSWQPDVVHCNDWQSALIPALLKTFPHSPATIFTIHNLAYQGLFSSQTFFDLGLPDGLWGMYGVEFYGQFSFIKGGLVYSDRINTVSPTYAKEIQQVELGYGLDPLLSHRHLQLSGIINGIDTDVWNPQKDKYLRQNYNAKTLHKKTANKSALQKYLKLPEEANIPVIGMISRLVEQKGLQSILDAMPKLMNMPIQIIILGTGERNLEQDLLNWAKQFPDKLSINIGYNEALAHQIEAAADIYLMPSIFEPCGLNQLYSLRYGTLPLARNVGGLADTVIDCNDNTLKDNTANGFIVTEDSAEALVTTMIRAIETYQNQQTWQQLQLNAMTPDRSWQSSALQYIELYEKAIEDNRARF